MYLQKPQRNKHSIGKHFRKIKNLRNKDPKSKQIPMPPQLQQYYNELTQQGLKVKNLKFALFQTSNGLKYPGLVATQKILANTVLVKVPVDLLLTTRDAFFSDVEKVFVENPGYFAKRWTSDWEDRIILTFLLYEYQRGEKSRWYNLIRNLPKDIDYAIFWSQSQLSFLQDPYMQKHIACQLQKFKKDSGQLLQILSNYPQFFNPSTLTSQNVIWLHTHLVTRCFGKYFEYTTMVPFAQLFNHQCVDVYYTMFYKPGNPYDEKEEFYQEKEIMDWEAEEADSSDGSYDAEDFQEADEVVEVGEGKEGNGDWVLDAEVYGQQVVKDIKSILYHMYTFINFSDSISLHYITEILKQLAQTQNIASWQHRKKKCQQIHTLNVLYIRKIKQFYKKLKRKYYTYAITQKQKLSEKQNQKQRQKQKQKQGKKQQDIPQKGVNYFQQDWPKDKFDQFYMLCSTKDQFEAGAQVFFCYGRLPNKLLLMRYGIALEYNKYDHMFLRIPITPLITSNSHLRTIAKQISIKSQIKFKLKRTKFCLQLIVYHRMQKWKYGQSLDKIFSITDLTLELEILYQCLSYYGEIVNGYQKKLEDNQKMLSDKGLGYHLYFGLVYKVEQQRMLNDQIRMVKYAMEVISKVREGKELKVILMKEQDTQRLRDQIIMEGYWKMLQGSGKNV